MIGSTRYNSNRKALVSRGYRSLTTRQILENSDYSGNCPEMRAISMARFSADAGAIDAEIDMLENTACKPIDDKILGARCDPYVDASGR